MEKIEFSEMNEIVLYQIKYIKLSIVKKNPLDIHFLILERISASIDNLEEVHQPMLMKGRSQNR